MMAGLPDPKELADEVRRLAQAHRRINVLLLPEVKGSGNDAAISLYWLDNATDFCHTSETPVADYAGPTPAAAAERIIDAYIEDADASSAGAPRLPGFE